ncbi:DoxX family protein [uncultured Marivirga sp.]|uniref:DoxX family protein n=1 Tax=uncultured Marivirga sp. TaxID=1123707 RepID=UPI0030EBE5E4|tara:strand:+ start:6803 stop:7519 length:717 start_codon:yes stop_codon:yes gene_type:complete
MSKLSKFEQYYLNAKSNRWYWLFSVFCRVSLAYAFIVAGGIKIIGERFASGLSVLHPMGAYLEALHQTGYYYTFIGYAQIIAAVLLLIPRTVVLGAMLYFPIILNICMLSLAVRFEGSFVTSPLMVLANLFLLVWHYDKLKFLLPFKNYLDVTTARKPKKYSNKFPIVFFLSVLVTVALIVSISLFGFDAMPRNSSSDCQKQFVNTENERWGFSFCDCIHNEGRSLDDCLEQYDISKL